MRALSVVCALTLACVVGACSDDAASGGEPSVTEPTLTAEVVVDHARIPVSPNPSIGAVYLEIVNGTDADDTLIGLSASVAAVIEVHRTTTDDDGHSSMHPEPELLVPAGETVSFEPGGLHIMLTDIIEPLEEGDTVALELEFATAGTVKVTADVVAFDAIEHADDAMGHEHG